MRNPIIERYSLSHADDMIDHFLLMFLQQEAGQGHGDIIACGAAVFWLEEICGVIGCNAWPRLQRLSTALGGSIYYNNGAVVKANQGLVLTTIAGANGEAVKYLLITRGFQEWAIPKKDLVEVRRAVMA